MANPQLLEYIGTHSKQGADKNQLFSALRQAGWAQADIEGVFAEIEAGAQSQEKELEIPPQHSLQTKTEIKPVTEQIQKVPSIQQIPLQAKPIPRETAAAFEIKPIIIPIQTREIFKKPEEEKVEIPIQTAPALIALKAEPGLNLRPAFIPEKKVLVRNQTEARIPEAQSKKSFRVAHVILFCLILAAFSSAYVYIPRLLQPKQDILGDALKNLLEIQSFDSSLTVSGDMVKKESLAGTEEKHSLKVTSSGHFDFRESLSLSQLFSFNLASQDKTLSYSFSADTRVKDNNFYITFLKAAFPDSDFNIAALNNKWMTAPLPSVKKETGISHYVKDLRPEEVTEIGKAIVHSEILSIEESLPDEIIDGIDTYHAKLAFNKENLKILILKIISITGSNPTPNEIIRFESELNQASLPSPEVWIGKSDLLLRKIIITTEIPSETSSGNYEAILSLSNFNSLVETETPTETVGFETVLAELLEKLP